MAFPKHFLDLLRDRVPLHDVVSKKVTLTKRNRDFLGLCPFHNEKTPSFTVNEDKGFYHCFGCGAHGDIITFEMQTNNLSFFEAVEKLSGQAGLEMPQTTPEDREKAKKQSDLREVLEMATKFYEEKLLDKDGAEALDYLNRKRGLSETTIVNFKLGFAPRGNQLYKHLKKLGIPLEKMEDACLVKKSVKNGEPYDYFRNRVMFPILDSKGRTVAFTGRVLDDTMPKYMNSSEGDLFQKAHILYGLSQARDEAFNKGGIIAVEGNIDVIALSQHGIKNVVAPMGTAISEHHLNLLWRVADTPYFCLDGDAAGYKAGIRTAMRALPVLKEGKSLKFVLLDEKKDPDDILRERGKQGLQEYFKNAISLSELLWRDLKTRIQYKTPEEKASVEKEIKTITDQIANTTVKKFYEKYFRDQMWQLFQENKSKAMGFKPKPKETFVSKNDTVSNSRDKIFLAYLVFNPSLFSDYLEDTSLFNSDDDMMQEAFDILKNSLFENPDLKTNDAINTLKDGRLDGVLESIRNEYNHIMGQDNNVLQIELSRLIKSIKRDEINKELKKSADWNSIKSLTENLKTIEKEIENLSLELDKYK
ncbi:MAG: DNA primase [Alphaproteobacteria bacterium]|jgi:DNA primase|nr:DNA primase [Alphaproteobacteria bacterium]